MRASASEPRHTSPLEESCLLFFFFCFFALSLSLDFDFFFLSLSLWTSRAASAPLPGSITAYWVEGAMQAGQQERHPGQSKGQYVTSIRMGMHHNCKDADNDCSMPLAPSRIAHYRDSPPHAQLPQASRPKYPAWSDVPASFASAQGNGEHLSDAQQRLVQKPRCRGLYSPSQQFHLSTFSWSPPIPASCGTLLYGVLQSSR